MSRKNQQGFTLLELLLALVASLVLIVILAQITGSATSAWVDGRERLHTGRQARSAFETLSRDLESRGYRPGTASEWLRIESDVDSEGIANGIRLLVLTSALDRYDGAAGSGNDLGGRIALSVYRLKFVDPISESGTQELKTYSLYRQRIDPDTVFEKFYAANDLLAKYKSEGYDKGESSSENFVCGDIIQLGVSCELELEEDGITKRRRVQIFDGSETKLFSVKGNSITLDDDVYPEGRVLSLEINLSVLTHAGANRLRISSAGDLKAFLGKHSRSFTYSIPVSNSLR